MVISLTINDMATDWYPASVKKMRMILPLKGDSCLSEFVDGAPLPLHRHKHNEMYQISLYPRVV